MTKKLIAILAAVALLLSFAACKADEDDKQGPTSSDVSSSQFDDLVVGDYGDDATGSEDTFSEDNLDDAAVESLWQQMNPTTEIN